MTRTGSRWKVLASLRTASGHVALTISAARILNLGLRLEDEILLTHHSLTLSLRPRVRYDVPDVILEPFVKHSVGFI